MQRRARQQDDQQYKSESISDAKLPTVTLTLPSKDDITDEEGFTVMDDTEFDYNDEESGTPNEKERVTLIREPKKTSSFSTDSRARIMARPVVS